MATEVPARMYPCGGPDGVTVPSCPGGCDMTNVRRAGDITYRECPHCCYAEISALGLDVCFFMSAHSPQCARFTTMRCASCGWPYCPDHCGPSGRCADCIVQETPGLGVAS